MASRIGAKLRVVPTGGPLGADIVGIDMKDLTDDDFAVVRRAFLDHLLLRIRGQNFDNPEHVAFCRRFGELGDSPLKKFTGKFWFDEFPEISVVTNIKLEGKPKGSLGFGDLVWHTDMNYLDEPPLGTFLHAYEVPATGGDTYFLNMYAAYDALSEAMKRCLDGLTLKHESVHSSSGAVRPGREEPASGDVRDYPGALHPLVRTHPETKRKSLYLGRRINAYILGLPVDESEALLEELWAHVDDPAFTWTQKWQAGDFIMWDNRCTMHRRDGFPPDERRLMHRLVVRGDRPF